MSVNIPCVEKFQLPSSAGSSSTTPKFWKKRDSIRSRDSGIRRADSSKSKYFDSEIQNDVSKPPLPFSRPPNPKESFIPPNQL